MTTFTERENGTGFVRGRVSKVEQHCWTRADAKGHFEWIHKSLLIVDHRYQRIHVSKTRIATIRSNWSWAACLCLGVVKHGDKYAVFDGQTRKLAADDRADIQELPCLVWDEQDLTSEAKLFLAVNTVRGPMRSHEKFRAEVIAGDPSALRVKELAEGVGLTIADTGPHGDGLGCVSAMKKLSGLKNASDLMAMISEIHLGRPPHSNIVRGIATAEDFLNHQGMTLLTRTYRDRLVQLGKDALLQSIGKAKAYRGKGGDKVEADGILTALNKGRSSRRLPSIYADGQ